MYSLGTRMHGVDKIGRSVSGNNSVGIEEG